jgi:glycosyltransferase involved in cell wall biosynthesis
LYFKAADVCVLPYTVVFQSGVLFLSYSFGLPVIATEVGSFEDDIVEGRNGFVCRACDAEHLAKTIEKYFDSDLFKNLDRRRGAIRKYANSRNSWNTVGTLTRDVYARLVGS